MNIAFVAEELMGGETLRFDTGNREITITNNSKHDRIANFPDLSAAATKVLYDEDESTLTIPRIVMVMVDPDNTYADDLATPASLTIGVYYGDTPGGANESTGIFFEVRREFPLVIPGTLRTAIGTATKDRQITMITGRNNQASGYGSINARCLVLA